MDMPMPADFPKATYERVEAHISRHLEGVDAATVPGFFGYAGGWNGLAIRCRAADEYASLALPTLATRGSLSNEERYAQERNLLGFFANTVSAVESCCFAVYHLGVMTKSPFFGKPDAEVQREGNCFGYVECLLGVSARPSSRGAQA